MVASRLDTGECHILIHLLFSVVTFCFRAFLKANAEEKEIVPPALNLTAQQLFWVGYGQDYCLLGDRFEDSENIKDILEYWVLLVFILIILNH